jgi:hypothetical protein
MKLNFKNLQKMLIEYLDLKIGVLKKFWYEFVQLNFKEFFPDEIL